MIKVIFFIAENCHKGFEISGHAYHGEAGSDIVCAAVSSAVYMAANTVTDIIGDDATVTQSDAKLTLTVNSPTEQTQTVLKGLELHLRELSRQYSENIKVIYGGVK